MEPANVTTPQEIRPAHHAEPLLLEGHVEQADAWKQGQH
jgi:hypothetical protein